MPNSDNDTIADFIVDLGWFQSQEQSYLPSDNWRLVKTADGHIAVLYIVLFHPASGEPRHVPNNKDTADHENTLPKLARLHAELKHPKTGPFIALAEVTVDGGIVNVRVWNVATKLSDGVKSLAVSDLRKPDFSHPRVGGVAAT